MGLKENKKGGGTDNTAAGGWVVLGEKEGKGKRERRDNKNSSLLKNAQK